jgi:peptidoglycan/LPS O-acetylase OafA/YrhL
VGEHGVTIFLVLSGFLITSRLLREEKINLPSFYLCRLRRLMPTAIAYLATILFVSLLAGHSLIGLKELASCLFSFRNYVDGPGNASLTIHFWSLSIQEQFYLLWPCTLPLFGPTKSFWIAISVACGCAWFRYLHWSTYDDTYAGYHTVARVDALLIGCAVAILLGNVAIRKHVARLGPPLSVAALLVLPYFFLSYQTLIPMRESMLYGILIGASSVSPDTYLCRVLSWTPVTFVGRISYSIYMWQIFFFVKSNPWAAVIEIPIASLLSYYFIENLARRRERAAPASPTLSQRAVGSLLPRLSDGESEYLPRVLIGTQFTDHRNRSGGTDAIGSGLEHRLGIGQGADAA